jgi:hypothetical protein
MSNDHLLARLRAADPVTWLRHETDAYAPPPRHVMAQIVASTPPPPPRGRRRRRLVLAAAAASIVAAAALGLLQLLPSDKRVDLAAKAYAATAPGDSVVYTERTLERTITPGFESAPAPDSQRIEERMWQHGDRVHRLSTILQWSGNGEPRRWNYEYDKRGDTLRILNPDGTVDTIRQGDPGWDPDETRQVLEGEQQTIVERFRTRYARAQLRDAGETVFVGRPAHAYVVISWPRPKTKPEPAPVRETFYLDPASGLPLGSVSVLSTWRSGKVNPRTRRLIPPTGPPDAEHRFTEIVDRYERLPATPENLAKLDAPAIDAARPKSSEAFGRPRRKRDTQR